ncbi:TetR/AcrR family transcriptional regulator [Actinoplanes sp. NPDC051494]|uniref:TetR/AcrR family transcriptional regulator n=1 Tax=Actinoplanes sp. NPDC051494 TaxID=3363907 RepID=UPI00378E8416
MVDHRERRSELAAAVWRVIGRDGVAHVSIRAVATESGWSSGALRHYFATRDELLAFACEHVIDKVTARLEALPTDGPVRDAVRRVLLETMPVDVARHTEASIVFSFLALGLGDAELARVQRLHFTGMYELCLRLSGDRPAVARRMHALVDGLTVHVLAGHLTVPEMIAGLDAFLDEVYSSKPPVQ